MIAQLQRNEAYYVRTKTDITTLFRGCGGDFTSQPWEIPMIAYTPAVDQLGTPHSTEKPNDF